MQHWQDSYINNGVGTSSDIMKYTPPFQIIAYFGFVLNLTKFIEKGINIYNIKLTSLNIPWNIPWLCICLHL